MTESQQPDRQTWSEKDLPVLTEVADRPEAVLEGVDIPDFDFSDEMELMTQASSGSADGGLDFPPELLLDDSGAKVKSDVALDFDQLPSLDLSHEDAAPPEAGFAFELEPLADNATPAPAAQDALPVRAQPAAPEAVGGENPVTLAEEIRVLDQGFDAVADMPIPTLRPAALAPAELDLALPDTGAVAPAEPQIPELTTLADDEDPANAAAAVATQAEIPQLTALAEAENDVALGAGAEPLSLASGLAEIPELTVEAEQLPLPESAAAAGAAEAQAEIPQLTALAEAENDVLLGAGAEPLSLASGLAEIPALTTEPPPLPESAAAAGETEAEAEEIAAVPELAAELTNLPVIEDAVEAVAPVRDSVSAPLIDVAAESLAAEVPEMLPAAAASDQPPADAQPAAEVSPLRTISLDSLPRGVLNGGVVLEAETDPVAPPSVEEMLRAAEQTLAQELRQQEQQSVNELVAAGVPAAAPGLQPEVAAVVAPVVEAAVVASQTAEAAVAADIGAEQTAPASVEDMIRAAEQTLAEELRKQALLRMNAELAASMATAATVEPAADRAEEAEMVAAAQPDPEPAAAIEPELPVVPAAAPATAPLAMSAPEPEAEPIPVPLEHRPVEIINVAGLASSSAPQPQMPPLRKSYVTLVDENMLIDSLYHKILPRMKVELSLWLQDALDHQAKQMLSGVMHQLKEDYEMLFSETLRDSLRQAISEMGREDRGERF